MPTDMIKKDAREGKGSVKSLEKKWDKAKDASKKSTGKGDDWALTNYIYQQQTKGSTMTVKLQAAARVLATEYLKGPFKVVFAKREPLEFKSLSALDKWSHSKETRNEGVTSWERVGHYGIVTFSNGDVAVSKQYANSFVEEQEGDEDMQPGSEHWDSTSKYRIKDCKAIAAKLKRCNHPLLKEVMKDIDAEIKYFERKS